MQYRLRTLGTPALQHDDGRPVDLALGRPFALLVYLALEAGPLTRDELAAVFWEGAPRERARQSVRQALWLLRRTLGTEAFLSEEPVVLNRRLFTVDVEELREALLRGDTVRAVSIWGGAFLEHFAIGNARRWQMWADERSDETTSLFAGALCQAARTKRDAGQIGTALGHLRRAVAVAPYRREAHELLVGMLLDARELDSAAAALANARRQLGEGPGGFDSGVFEARLVSLRESTRLRTETGLYAELVGRTGEMADMLGLWRAARGGNTCVAVVSGPTGIGKTRLAEEVAAAAEADGGTVVSVKASEGERAIEFGLVAAVIRRLLRLRGAAGVSGASDAVLRTLVPSLSSSGHNPLTSGTDAAGDQKGHGASNATVNVAALADALVDLVDAVAEDAPLLILFDDLHWADPQSRRALSMAMRNVREAGCLFIATHRPEESGPELVALLRSLVRDCGASLFTLRPLSTAEVAELLGLMAEFSEPDQTDRIAQRLHGVTDGNPLFLVELLRGMQEDGIVEMRAGRWYIRADRLPGQFPLPASVRAVVDRRLERLSADSASLAGHLARLPHGASLDALRQRSSLGEGAFTRATAELLEREVVRWTRDAIGFTHDQLRDGALRRFPVAVMGNGGEDAGRRRARRRRALVAIAGIVAVLVPAATLAVRQSMAPATAPLYGGGALHFVSGNVVLAAEPPVRGGRPWSIRPYAGKAPPVTASQSGRGPFFDQHGDLVWYLEVVEQGIPPWLERFEADGSRTRISRDSGDVVMGYPSPDGRFISYVRDDPSMDGYDRQLMVSAADGSEARPLAGPVPAASYGGWSPDGHAVVARLTGPDADTVVVFLPRAQRVTAIPLPGHSLMAPVWCSPPAIAVQVFIRDAPHLAVVDPETAEVRILDVPGPEGGLMMCSPDGNAVAYRAIASGRLANIVQDLDGGTPDVLDIPATATLVNWLPEQPIVPTRIEIRSVPRQIQWGEQLRLVADIALSDGRSRESAVRWESTDTLVLSVDSAGVVVGNRPGNARILATTPSWLADTVSIEVVRGDVADGPILDESFRELDRRRWLILGDAPDPRPVVEGGEPALELTGDGQYADGIVLRQAMELPRGATLEAEFRISLTRWDQQTFRICLRDADPFPGTEGRNPWDWDLKEQVCFGYPARLETSADPERVQFSAAGATRNVRVAPDLPSGRWTHIAIQLDANGDAYLLVNRRRLSTSPTVVRMTPGHKWRIWVEGEAVDTRVLVRNLALWDGPRS